MLVMTMTTTGKVWGQRTDEQNRTEINNLADLKNIAEAPTGSYIIKTNIDASDASSSTPAPYTTIASFSGTLEAAIDPNTKMPYRIQNLRAPLFTTLTGTVKNVVIENVGIRQSGMVGAIACTANSTARIYNVGILSGSVESTGESRADEYSGCCGGLVGLLDGEARVVNCYSYADINGGNKVGGIVGYNNVATASNNLKTMVFGCMFYGEIKTDNCHSVAPVYNGTNIVNKDANGVSNYNYFRLEASYVQPTGVTYNCALGAEDRFLQRFEFYRHLLNSHRELAGWWATGTYSSTGMHKWVMTPDSIGTNHPYPVLKEFGYYPSVVNIDADNAQENQPRNKGGKLGTLEVTIRIGDGGAVFGSPTGATITKSDTTLVITDKDPDHFNFNYYKVQLPYYNDVGTKNYNGNRVVTGWKIVSIEGGTEGTFEAGADAKAEVNDGIITLTTPFNFADRHCNKKDLYEFSGRVFNQGAYWDVPEGVTAITIEPYWARCVYLADAYADVVYNAVMENSYNVSNVGGGEKYTNGRSYSIAGENQVVYTTMGNAIASSGTALFSGVDANAHTVYDYAVVLVGNYHHIAAMEASNSKPYTVTSIDLDGDNEPDYSYILRFNGRTPVHPVRVDFINIPGLGMAQKSTGGTGSYNFGILQPKNFFESTNTSLFRVTQFEYDAGRAVEKPYIVQGGVFEQWVGGQQTAHKNLITYFHVGGNVWFKEFHRGCHQDKTWTTKHPPVSVTGGDYDEFYLTGLYRGDVANYNDNLECYVNGGRFGIVAGAAQEGGGNTSNHTNGNVVWQIQNADISEFYAGGINAAKPLEGNIATVIEGGYIQQFCGGPKFGDMNTGKTVTTNATDCIFGKYFGAGYGGNSYSRFAPQNQSTVINIDWNAWVRGQYTQTYNGTYGGVSTQFNYQFIPMSDNKTNVARLFVEFVKFSMATTRSVASILDGCTVDSSFFGGGSLGKVDGNVTSVLKDCTVKGNVFGAGYSASTPTVEVDSIGFRVPPYYYEQLGTYRIAKKGQTTTYTWEHGSAIGINTNDKILYTTESLEKNNLGSISGNVTLTLKGSTTVGTLVGSGNNQTLKAGTGNVYGGGDESHVTYRYNNNTNPPQPIANTGNTTVNLEGSVTVYGNVYGGGNNGPVEGNSEVKIQDTP